MKNTNKKLSAFTLIELLVVIVIIGILSGIGIAGFNSYKEKADNAKGQAECNQIQKCEQIRATCVAGGETDSQCQSLCSTSGLVCNAYPPEDQWTDASCFSFSGSTINGFNSCSDTDIIVPKNISGTVVTRIGSSAFQFANINSITLPFTITDIGDSAFDLASLRFVSMPGVKTIGPGAFYGMPINSISLPNGLETIGSIAFADTSINTPVYIPDSVTSIGSDAFNGYGSMSIPEISIKSTTNYQSSSFPPYCTVQSGCLIIRP